MAFSHPVGRRLGTYQGVNPRFCSAVEHSLRIIHAVAVLGSYKAAAHGTCSTLASLRSGSCSTDATLWQRGMWTQHY